MINNCLIVQNYNYIIEMSTELIVKEAQLTVILSLNGRDGYLYG